jgi:hypothetical protein
MDLEVEPPLTPKEQYFENFNKPQEQYPIPEVKDLRDLVARDEASTGL